MVTALLQGSPRFVCPRRKNSIQVFFPDGELWGEYLGHRDGVHNRCGTVISVEIVGDDLVKSESDTGSIQIWSLLTLRHIQTILPAREVLKMPAEQCGGERYAA